MNVATYKGKQAALNIEVEGQAFRFKPNQPALLTKAQEKSLKSRDYIKGLIDSESFEIDSVDSLKKADLVSLMRAEGFKITGKETVKKLTAMFKSNADDSNDDDGDDDDGDNDDKTNNTDNDTDTNNDAGDDTGENKND